MTSLRCEAVRWISDEPQPGWIEVALTDAAGRVWWLFDKPPIFERGSPITKDSDFPLDVEVRVEIIEDGDPILVSTAPDGVESEEGQYQFRVPASAIRR